MNFLGRAREEKRKGVERAPIVVAVISSILLAQAALAQDSEWRLFGTNDLTVDWYSVGGENDGASPYRFEGTFFTERLDLNLALDDPAGRAILIRAELISTDSDYFERDGFIVGKMSYELEDGRGRLPYRVNVGDLYADLSRRVLQRDIRGASLELQPGSSSGVHSILVASGSGARDWRGVFDDEAGDVYFNGISYLYSSETGDTTIVANVLDARHRAGSDSAFPVPVSDQTQLITSLFGETKLGGVVLEAEASFLDGEDGAESFDDTSFYAQISRNDDPVKWNIRYEENGESYAPIGGLGIISNRRIGEAHARWRVGRQSNLRARAQYIERNFEGDEIARDDTILGFDWDSRPLASRRTFKVQMGADYSTRETDNASVDQTFTSYRIGIEDRIGKGWRVSAGYRYRDQDDDVNADLARQQSDLDLGLGRTFRVGGVETRLGAGVVYREQDGHGAYETVSPTFDVAIRAGDHSFAGHVGLLDQRFASPTVEDLEYLTSRLTYSVKMGNHAVSFEVNDELRNPESGPDTKSTRMSLRYRYSFDHPL